MERLRGVCSCTEKVKEEKAVVPAAALIIMKEQGGFLISQIKQIGGRIFEQILAKKNIDAFNGAQGRILYVLWQGDGIPINEISHQTGLAVTSLTSMIDRMEAAGLIYRDRGDSDRRKILIYLTDNAKTLEKDYDQVTKEISDIYYKDFTKDEVKQFESYLHRILKNLEEYEK